MPKPEEMEISQGGPNSSKAIFPSAASYLQKKTGRQLDRSHRPARGGMNETYKRIDPITVAMFKLG